MKTHPWTTPALALGAALALVALAPAAADEHETPKKKVRVHKIAECDGDDCPEPGDEGAHVVKIKKIVRCVDGDCTETVESLGDGDLAVLAGEGKKRIEIRKVVCDGEDCPEGEHEMVFVGDGGEVRTMKMGGGHAWTHHSGGPGGFLGVGLTDLTPELRTHFGVSGDAGVMVAKVMDGSPAQRAGIEVGDIITSAGGAAVASGSELAHRVRKTGDGESLDLEVWRGGAARTLSATIEHKEQQRRAAMAGGGHGMHKRVVVCDDDEEDCGDLAGMGGALAGIEDYDCGAPECEVQVECRDGECTCTVNGEDADCADIPGVPSSG